MVTVVTTVHELQEIRKAEKSSIGFVPTMGNLHQGHISLLERSLIDFDVTYFSIFVNPKQFGPNEDFNKYPRTLEHDLELIEVCLKKFPNKKIFVFAPTDPQDVFPKDYNQTISVPSLNSIVEGLFRPGHFDGVSTVVYRLFELVRPNKAYFGLKDYQQYLVIKQMVKDLALPIEIVGMPIIRTPSGLALSSRNQFLSEEQKNTSIILNQSLNKVTTLIAQKKSNLPIAQKAIDEILKDKKWNYLEMRDAESLSADLSHSKKIAIVAVYQLGTTRLLDNIQTEIS